VEIDAPRDTVFHWLTEPELMKRWVGGLLEFEPLDPGPALGSRSRQVMRVKGQSFGLESVITAFDPPTSLEVRIDHKGFDSTSRYRVDEEADRTRVTATIETSYKLFANRLLGGLVTREAQKKLVADLDRLKQRVEAEG
jgi:uncharacterized protein YndB with AHSA1/START domain